MKITRKHLKLALLVSPVLAAFASPGAYAQAWPTKQPIRLISPYAPGGATGVIATILAQHLTAKLGQTVTVEFKPGAGGNVGTGLVARSAPDGYTLLMAASGPIVIAPSLYKNLPYQPLKDFTVVAPAANAAFVLLTNPQSGLKKVEDIVKNGKVPGKLSFASAGAGTPQHIIAESFNMQAGTDIAHVPFKGSGPAVKAIIAGEIPMGFENPVAAMPHIKAGKVTVVAVTGDKRSILLPDVPTIAEQGITGFDARPWYGVLAPAGLPSDITAKLNTAIGEILAMPEVKEKLAGQGAETMLMPSDKFQSYVAQDLEKWSKVVKKSGATAD